MPQAVGRASVFPAEFEKGTLDMQIVLDNRGLIAGLSFTPHVATKPAPEKHQTQLSLPIQRPLAGLVGRGYAQTQRATTRCQISASRSTWWA